MKNLMLFVLVSFLVVSIVPVQALNTPNVDVLMSWNNYQANHNAKVYWNNDGNIRTVVNNIPASKISAQTINLNEAEKIARDYLKKNEALFGVQNINSYLKLDKFVRTGNSCHVRFQQYHDGLLVQNSGMKLHIIDNQVVMATSSINNSAINASDKKVAMIGADKAKELALKDLNSEKLRDNNIKVDLVFSAQKGFVGKAYSVKILSEKPMGDYEYLINSENGKILSVEDHMEHFATKCKVYKYNPLKGQPEIFPLSNQKEATDLSGKYINMLNDDAQEAKETDGTFYYEVGNTHFEEAMAYYHLNLIHDYYKKNFNFTKMDYALPVHVHYGDNYDNAFFSPWQGILAFGDGNKLNNLAREAAVMYHEYTHAVTGKFVSLHGGEAGAINEALSDYFACSVTEDPMIGEWAMAKLHRDFMRNCDNKSHYPEDIKHEVHADSIMYSGSLWDFRKVVGKKIADKIVHFSRAYMPDNATFKDGLVSMIASDKEYFNGKYKEAIVKSFAKHGIVSKDLQTVKEFEDMLRFEGLNNGNKKALECLNEIENIK